MAGRSRTHCLLLLALGAGTLPLAACGGDATAPSLISAVELSPDTATLRVGYTRQLQATVRDTAGNAVTDRPVTWASSDTRVATVSEAGVVTGLADGEVRISAAVEGRKGEARLKVSSKVPGLWLVLGQTLTDTVTAAPEQPLVVEVMGSDGAVIPGVAVRFRAMPTLSHKDPWYGSPLPTVWVGDMTNVGYDSVLTVITDSQGRAAVRLQLGQEAGVAKVVVTAPTLGYQDTARFTIKPGAAVRVRVAPRDTALYVGGSYALRGGVVDRFDNTRPEAVTYEAGEGVNVQDGTVRAASIGRGRVIVRGGSVADTGFVSVVPQGTLAAVGPSGSSLLTFNLDGSGLETVLSNTGVFAPQWAPDGRSIVFTGGTGGHLRITDLNGAARPLVENQTEFAYEHWAHFAPDAAWIYFEGQSRSEGLGVYRMRPDGTGAERVLPASVAGGHPSLSPDGTRLTFYQYEGSSVQVKVLDLRNGSVTATSVQGHVPEWSPTGDRIAYVSTDYYYSSYGPLAVANADGSGQRTVSPAGRSYVFGFDWSPDGKWLVARSANTGLIELVNVESGMVLPLAFTAQMQTPAWKP